MIPKFPAIYTFMLLMTSSLIFQTFSMTLFTPIGPVYLAKYYNIVKIDEQVLSLQLINFFLCFGAILGALIVGSFADYFGRKETATLLEFTRILVYCMYMIKNLYCLYVTRSLDGILIGMTLSLYTTYAREV